MKVLIDECAPKALRVALGASGFDCTSVQEAGWSGKENGELLAESRKHSITAKLRQIPSLGPIRSALAVALIQTPHRCLLLFDCSLRISAASLVSTAS
jgi:hypothetical protein